MVSNCAVPGVSSGCSVTSRWARAVDGKAASIAVCALCECCYSFSLDPVCCCIAHAAFVLSADNMWIRRGKDERIT